MSSTVLTRRVTLPDLQRWAELSGDANPLHVDPDYARGTRYGRPIAHGHLTLTWVVAWAMARYGPAFVHHGRIDGLRFLAPVLTDTDYAVVGAPDAAADLVEVRAPDGTVAVRARVRVDAGEDAT